jgi:hypothetical protein
MKRSVLAVVFSVVAMLAVSSSGISPAAAATPRKPASIRVTPIPPPPPVPSVGARLFQAGLAASGTVVRRTASFEVTRVVSGRTTLYRVRVNGVFPPRALRYVVSAGGRPVGYGVPTPDGRAVQSVTRDRAVLDAAVSARYEGALQSPGSAGGSSVSADGGATGLARGPYDVAKTMYDFGDEVWQPPGLGGRVEITADVHYPRGLPGGPFPIVMFLHGNHVTCFKGDKVDFRWPCRPGWKSIPNYRGYDYMANRLASFGFVVVSISTNGVNVLGGFQLDTGMRQRGLLIERHLDLWHHWSTAGGGPFGDRFVGKVDFDHIGVMGHSRGGEGAIWNVIVDRQRPDPYGIDAVLALAPVDFTRRTINHVPFAVMLPYCDGDVSDLQGMHFFDDARYRVPGDPTPKHTVTVMGANHNFFNTVWTPGGYPGGFDDGVPGCRERLTAPEERNVGSAYIVDFMRRYVTGDVSLDDVWTGARKAPGSGPARTLVSYLAPDEPGRRLDVDRFATPSSLSHGEGGGAVTPDDLLTYGWCADTYEVPCVPGRAAFRDVHLQQLGQGVVGWSTTGGAKGVVSFDLPPGSNDVSGFDALQFRAGVNIGYSQGFGFEVRFHNLLVVLEDGSGNRSYVAASEAGNDALEMPVGRFSHVMLNQIRFALTRFDGVDLTDIVRVELRFTRTPSGVIDLADLAFSKGAA